MHLEKTIPFKRACDTQVNIKVNAQRRSMKAIFLLVMEPYSVGARDAEKYVFPVLAKVRVIINVSPNMLYNEGIVIRERKNKTEHMNLKLFLTGDRLGLLIDLRSMTDRTMHGSGTRLVNTTDGVQLELERSGTGSGNLNCQAFVISDS